MSIPREWNVQLIRCRRKSVGIRVTDDGEIVVRSPLRMPQVNQ